MAQCFRWTKGARSKCDLKGAVVFPGRYIVATLRAYGSRRMRLVIDTAAVPDSRCACPAPLRDPGNLVKLLNRSDGKSRFVSEVYVLIVAVNP